MPAALTTINIAKEQSQTYQSLLLAEMTFVDGSVGRFAMENLDSTEGGPQYKGHDWLPRIQQQSLGALQSVSDNGLVQYPRVSLDFADADRFIWNTYEVPDGLGIKGTKLVLKFVFWDA